MPTGTCDSDRTEKRTKLRAVGVILDGDRDHPALAKGIPDIFHPLGEQAVLAVLRNDAALAGRLGIDPASPPANSARRVFNLSILLERKAQDELFELVKREFDALVMDAEAREENPLEVPELDGYVDLRAPSPYTVDGEGSSIGNGDSAFGFGVTISTGVWHRRPGLSGTTVAAAARTAREAGDAKAMRTP